MKTEAGLNVCRRLATEWADVLVENFKVGTLEKQGLDYENLSRDNPGLVFCSITGFGPTGPLAQNPGVLNPAKMLFFCRMLRFLTEFIFYSHIFRIRRHCQWDVWVDEYNG
jgi:hypothetical protein